MESNVVSAARAADAARVAAMITIGVFIVSPELCEMFLPLVTVLKS